MIGVVHEQWFVINESNKNNFGHRLTFTRVEALVLWRALTLGQCQPLSFAQSTRSVRQKHCCLFRLLSQNKPAGEAGRCSKLQQSDGCIRLSKCMDLEMKHLFLRVPKELHLFQEWARNTRSWNKWNFVKYVFIGRGHPSLHVKVQETSKRIKERQETQEWQHLLVAEASREDFPKLHREWLL